MQSVNVSPRPFKSRQWLLTICMNTIWLPPNWNIHTGEQMAPFTLLTIRVPWTLLSCLRASRPLNVLVSVGHLLLWPWYYRQTLLLYSQNTTCHHGAKRRNMRVTAASSLNSTLWYIHVSFSRSLQTALTLTSCNMMSQTVMARQLRFHFNHKGITQNMFLIDLIWIHF